jgi:hypothetical protein
MKVTNASTAPPYWGRAALTAAGLGALVALLAAKAVPCGFAALTHHPCPGCGSTRAVLALVSGDLEGVLRHNPLGPVMAVVLGVLVVQTIASVLREGDLRSVGGRTLTRTVMVVAGLETVLWVARFCGAFGGPVPV